MAPRGHCLPLACAHRCLLRRARCLSPALTIAACLSYKPPFTSSYEQRDAAERAKLALVAPDGSAPLAAGHQSDHLAMLAAYRGWQQCLAAAGMREARGYVDTWHSTGGAGSGAFPSRL